MAIPSLSGAQEGPLGQQSFRYLERPGLQKLGVPQDDSATPTPAPGDATPDFLELVKGFVGNVNDISLHSGKTIEAFAAGEITDIHQVMVAVQEAGLALDLLLEIRNRTLEAFQEIMRLQV